MGSSKVILCIYDLADQLKKENGITIPKETIWHSSIIVYGKEYSYGLDGIKIMKPVGTPYRMKILGQTKISKEEFDNFVQRLKLTWTSDTYSLIHKNCHNFSQLLLQYLDVSDLPKYLFYTPEDIRKLGFSVTIKTITDGIYDYFAKINKASKSS